MPKESHSLVSLLMGLEYLKLLGVQHINKTNPPPGFTLVLLLSPPFTSKRFFPIAPLCSLVPVKSLICTPASWAPSVLLEISSSDCPGSQFEKADEELQVRLQGSSLPNQFIPSLMPSGNWSTPCWLFLPVTFLPLNRWGGDISWAHSRKRPIPAENSVLPLPPENKSAPASPHFSPDGGILIAVTGERGEGRCGLAAGHRVRTSYTLHLALTAPPPVPWG